MNKTTKRYLISSGVTFISVFLVTLGVSIGNVDAEAVQIGTILGLLITAGRAGVKAVYEQLIKKYVENI